MPPAPQRTPRRKYPRPPYVAAICWKAFAWGVTGFIAACILLFGGGPVWPMAGLVALPLSLVVSSLFMLRGAGWARMLFFITGVLLVPGLYFAMQMSGVDTTALAAGTITCAIFVAACSVILCMERANYFFAGRPNFLSSDSDRKWGGENDRPDDRHSEHHFDY
ncbi:MAG TPA: hypothetical protein VHC44_13405 [Verrucomicrobiae bacterium]|nr:hypothetical protein [Verrucomicrobiae bacterium]